MEKKSSIAKQTKNRSTIPKTPPLHEEPLRGIDPRKILCEICGKAFSSKNTLDRHMINEHESAQGKK